MHVCLSVCLSVCQPISGACEARYQALSRPGLSPFWLSGGDLSLARSVTGCRPGPAGSVEEARYQGLPRPGLSLGWGVAASGTCPCSTCWRAFGCFFDILFMQYIQLTFLGWRPRKWRFAGHAQTCPPGVRCSYSCLWHLFGPVQSFRAQCRRLHCEETCDTWTFHCQSVSQTVSQSSQSVSQSISKSVGQSVSHSVSQ